MSREENIAIFREIEALCKADDTLKSAIQYASSNQKLVLEKDELLVPTRKKYSDKAEVIVSKKRSYEAASYYNEYKTCVHNFASATTPGGGVVKGSSAQEECLCRCSTLYFNLNSPDMWNGFYMPHRMAQNPVHNDDCIYTPGVIVMKSDTLLRYCCNRMPGIQ